MIGIYTITVRDTGEVYVGCSIDIEQRWQRHERDLAAGTHIESALLARYEQFGKRALAFAVVERCASLRKLPLLEWDWIKRLQEQGNLLNRNVKLDCNRYWGFTMQEVERVHGIRSNLVRYLLLQHLIEEEQPEVQFEVMDAELAAFVAKWNHVGGTRSLSDVLP